VDKPLAAKQGPGLLTQGGVGGASTWAASGAWTLDAVAGRFTALEAEIAAAQAGPHRWDLRGIAALDSAGALLLWRGWGHRRPDNLALRPEHEALFSALAAAPLAVAQPVRSAAFDAPGRALLSGADHALSATRLVGQLAMDALRWLRSPREIAWREISANVYRAGAQALPITALVGFLVGLTLAYLTARQLKTFGADVFLVNILGIAVCRELGPMLAAILVAGRSGSAMTAQLGVMRVTQELDALSVMGISHTARLVLPKLIALAVALPLVTAWTGAMMLAGGMLAAQTQLGTEPLQFLQALPAAVPASNLALGLGKAAAFGALVALVACHFGLRVRPDTESLAAGTTAAVVTSITAVIVLDAVVAVMFSDVGL
jgi:phospholipid/cholesterol/gamma-HCH transport system permease protein